MLPLLDGVVSLVPQYGAAADTGAGNIVLIATLSPLPVTLVERIAFGTRLRPLALVGVALAFAGIGASGSFARLVSTVGAARASMSMYLVPGYALALGATLLGESLHAYHALAMALVLGGVALGTIGPAVARPN
nr:EamA family transporter [Pseudoroseomonas vastitatis]